jgi:hypothetical protein
LRLQGTKPDGYRDMNGKPELSIRAAIMKCLERCQEGDTPLTCLGDFVEDLHRMGWADDDVQTVQMAVVRALAKRNQRNPVYSFRVPLGRSDANLTGRETATGGGDA